MLSFFLLVVLIAVALGIVGFVVHGLFWLFLVAVVLFLASLAFGGSRLRSRFKS